MNKLDLLLIALLDANTSIDNIDYSLEHYHGIEPSSIRTLCQQYIVTRAIPPGLTRRAKLEMAYTIMLTMLNHLDEAGSEDLKIPFSETEEEVAAYHAATTELVSLLLTH